MLGSSILMLIIAIVCGLLARSAIKSGAEYMAKAKAVDPDSYDARNEQKHYVHKAEAATSVSSWFKYGAWGSIGSAIVLGIGATIITVPAGHVKVATLFGKVQSEPWGEGIHFVNPLYEFTEFDTRQKTHKENAGVPSEDKLITNMDVSVQFRTIASMAPEMLQNTGTTSDVINVHMIPKLRSILREQGKGVPQAQDFFQEAIQTQLQASLQSGLSEYLVAHGIRVDNVLIRGVVLPQIIRTSIEETKKREQEVLKQQAELDRFAKEQEQKVATAQAEFDAAKLEAQKIKELADAEAYKIAQLNDQLAKSPQYIELKRVEQWDGILPVYAGGDNIPMINLQTLTSSK